jgi:hypothetical protein
VAESSTAEVKRAGRAWEDAYDPLDDSYADRDFAHDHLAITTKRLRLRLASRDLKATKQAPYLSIFPEGIDYYTAAPRGEASKRYQELAVRVEAHLSPDDPARQEALPLLSQGIQDLKTSEQEILRTKNQVALASSALETSAVAWSRQMEKIYAALVDSVGRAEAENFFPKLRASQPKAKERSKAA